jgi:hypothetical protein
MSAYISHAGTSQYIANVVDPGTSHVAHAVPVRRSRPRMLCVQEALLVPFYNPTLLQAGKGMPLGGLRSMCALTPIITACRNCCYPPPPRPAACLLRARALSCFQFSCNQLYSASRPSSRRSKPLQYRTLRTEGRQRRRDDVEVRIGT